MTITVRTYDFKDTVYPTRQLKTCAVGTESSDTSKDQACPLVQAHRLGTIRPRDVSYKGSMIPEMRFLDKNLTEDSSILLNAIHSLFYWRIL